MAQIELDRRQFMVTSALFAGGLAVGMSPSCADAATPAGPWAPDRAGPEFSAWIAINPDDSVIVRVPTPEMGNGAMTQVAMNVTEELACDWAKVKVEYASFHRNVAEKDVYQVGGQPFFSGHGTDPVRMQRALQLGASARERLKAAAAAKWQVPVGEIGAARSVLTHLPTGRTLRFGQVAAQAATIQLVAEPKPKPQSEWTFLGKASPGKKANPDIVTGRSTFGIDVKLPGMVHAALLQCPVHGGRLKSFDASAVLKMPGVRAVVSVDPARTKGSPVPQKSAFGLQDTKAQHAVAVIADHIWQAKQALTALPVEWDLGDGVKWKDSDQFYAAMQGVLDRGEGRTARKAGDVASVTGKSVVEATYRTPFCENATLEPLNATALSTPDRIEVWAPSQDMQQCYWVTVDETGLTPDKVFVHQTHIGGGFGRRSLSEEVRMAVAVAREYPGVPVKLIWSREEMFHQGRYRTPVMTRFKAKLNEQGMPDAIEGNACMAGLQLPFGYSDIPYFTSGIIPHVRLLTSNLPHHVLTGAYRGPCYNSHAFMVESFIDECAHAAGADPLDYRLKLLAKWDEAWGNCLKVAADKAGWGRPLPKGEGRGIAISNWPMASMRKGGATIATVVHTAVAQDGTLKVKQVDVAFDCGRIANRDAVLAQLEGGVIFGLNSAINEEVTLRDGAIAESNFDEYPMLRMADMPQINIHFDALSGHDRFAIIGEAPVGPVQAALTGAIFQATGKRLRTTPLRKHDLSWS